MEQNLAESHQSSCSSYFQKEHVKGSLSASKNENKRDKDFYCTLHKFVLIRFIQRNQGHRDSMMHEFHSNVNKVNNAVAKVRTVGDRLSLKTNDGDIRRLKSGAWAI